MSKITDYTPVTRFDKDDVILKDGTNGTKKIKASDAAAEFAGLVSPINHRNIYRGGNLGGSVSDAQKKAIQDGSFDDLFIGDYWNIGSINWRIADMNYWYNCGEGGHEFKKNHLVIVPDTIIGANAVMNTTADTSGGYYNASTRQESGGVYLATQKVKECFGELLLTHRENLVNASADGHASASAWYDITVELMNEIMVYGCYIFAAMNTGGTIPHLYTCSNSQLSLFRLNPQMIKTRQNYWLRDVASASAFANVNGNGSADYGSASNTITGVRPAFAIG